jgi:hypothetical protein
MYNYVHDKTVKMADVAASSLNFLSARTFQMIVSNRKVGYFLGLME